MSIVGRSIMATIILLWFLKMGVCYTYSNIPFNSCVTVQYQISILNDGTMTKICSECLTSFKVLDNLDKLLTIVELHELFEKCSIKFVRCGLCSKNLVKIKECYCLKRQHEIQATDIIDGSQ